MTFDDIAAAINEAAPGEAEATAEAMLAKYQGDDKDLIAPHLISMAILADSEGIEVEL